MINFRKVELKEDMKDMVAEQLQEAKKMEKRLAEGVELMEGDQDGCKVAGEGHWEL